MPKYIVSRENLAWAAGFFDGEGHVHYAVRRTARGTAHQAIGSTVAQSDRERLDFLAAVLGVGRVHGPYHSRNERAQPYHQWCVNRFELVQHVGAAMWPWLGPPKRQQFYRALSSWQAFVPDIALCEHGAEKLRCAACRSQWVASGWARRPRRLNVDRDSAIAVAVECGESRRQVAAREGIGYGRVCQIVRAAQTGGGS